MPALSEAAEAITVNVNHVNTAGTWAVSKSEILLCIFSLHGDLALIFHLISDSLNLMVWFFVLCLFPPLSSTSSSLPRL